MNPINGEKKVTINGQGYTMRFTWRALAAIESEFGDNPNLFNAEVLSKVAAMGFAEAHPDMTADKIMELSPPLMPFCAAVREAIQWAYFGTEAMPKAEPETEVKKNRVAGMLSRLIKRLSRRE